MICPHCGSPNNRVVNSRDAQNSTAIRRRRECLNCGERFTTFEQIEEVPVLVLKHNGTREPYDKEKILRGLHTACRKRPVPKSEILEIVARVEGILFNRPVKEVESSEIGALVMEELRGVDEVAYVRFASVYRQFSDIDEFLSELEGLRNSKTRREKTK